MFGLETGASGKITVSERELSMKEARERWGGIQYRGDFEDMCELFDKYNVEGFLSARKEQEREQGVGLRDRLLKEGVLLTETLSPRIYAIVRGVQERLGIDGRFDVFCIKDVDVNAFAYLEVGAEEDQHLIGITSGALEMLEDDEIAGLIGHELGHFVFRHNEILGLLNHDQNNEKMTVLPYLGECLFMKWRKKGELSADRLGLIASGSFEASARALVKAGFGLSAKNLNLEIGSLLKQIEAIKDKPEAVEEAFRSHPLLPLRLQALSLFATQLSTGKLDGLPEVEAQIEGLFSWFRRYPRKPLHEAVMRIVALAGLKIVATEGEVDDEEIRSLIYCLHSHFTDAPEKELSGDSDTREKRLTEAIELVNKEGGAYDKNFVICRLADLALADGKLLKAEAGEILEVAQALGLPPREAYGLIVGAAQTVGFNVDYRMKEIVRDVRTQLVSSVRGCLDLKDSSRSEKMG